MLFRESYNLHFITVVHCAYVAIGKIEKKIKERWSKRWYVHDAFEGEMYDLYCELEHCNLPSNSLWPIKTENKPDIEISNWAIPYGNFENILC